MASKQKPSSTRLISPSQEKNLQQRLKEAEDTLQAIREGAVDALIVETGDGDQVFTLKSADYPYRLIIDKMIQGAVIFDDSGIIFYANTTFAEMVNHSHQDLFGFSLHSFISTEDRKFFATLTSTHSPVSGGTGTIHLLCHEHPNLVVFVGVTSLNIDGQQLHCAILTDLTEQKRYDRALAEEKFSRKILEQTGEAVVVCDRSGRIIRHSRATERLIHQPILHSWFHEHFHLTCPDSQASSGEREPWNENRSVVGEILAGKTLQGLEVSLQVGDIHVPVLLSGNPLWDEEENTIGAIITMVDITDRKKAEQDLQAFNDLLEQRIKTRTQDLLNYQQHLRDMSSELVVTEQRERRRLATELHDYLAQLLVVCRMKLAQQNRQNWSPELKTDIDDIDKILTDSLTYTRTLIAELSPNILYELGIVPALVWLGGQFERHNLHVRIHEEEKNIQLSEDHAIFVFQAVRELLFNIMKHADTKEASIHLKRTPSREFQVTVEDAGKGFHLPNSSPDYASPGKFGLFSIRERLEALGGRIHIESKEGQGTQITLVVPFDSMPPSEVSPHPQSGFSTSVGSFSQNTGRGHGIRILLVDDHALVRQGIRGLLDVQHDFQVVGEAQNGLEAIEYTRTLHPDIIVMDVNMPILNGIEATKNIVSEFPSMPIIGLSVQEDRHVQELMLQAGAVMYLTKNGMASQLVDSIRHVLPQRSL
jgi:PAS domain S-box-containing protein